MLLDNKICIGKSENGFVSINPKMANRHGIIAGATGTGKTVTLRVLAESFSDMGVPVFLADVKGDLSNICTPGAANENIDARVAEMGLTDAGFTFKGYPVNYWDIFGKQGLPLRTTISEMGPLLLGRILGLTDVQADILTVIFKIADDNGLLLLDTKDLKSMIQYVSENRDDFIMSYGNMAPQSLAAIVRSIVALEAQGGEEFFGEPALSIDDWLCTDSNGNGMINILAADKLISNPAMYSAFLLWMMSELFENLPEVGDPEKPKLVFFFDEAHLLFRNAGSVLLDKIEQVVRLIRSKGVGIYFVTQNPQDIPGNVLGQLGNRVQHALRAYTPAEQKGLKAAAASFRVNPAFDTVEAMASLGTGEALVSVLEEGAVPSVVEKCRILPPQSMLGVIDEENRASLIQTNPLYSKYAQAFDRESAYELLAEKAAQIQQEEADKKQAEAEEIEARKQAAAEAREAEKQAAAEAKAAEKAAAAEAKARAKAEADALKALQKKEEQKKKKINSAIRSTASTTGGTIGREIGKSVGNAVGGKFGKTLGGNVGASIGRGLLGGLFKK